MHSFARTPAFRTISLAGQGRGLSPSNDRVWGVKWRVCADAITISPSVSPEADRSPFADSLQRLGAAATVPSARRRSAPCDAAPRNASDHHLRGMRRAPSSRTTRQRAGSDLDRVPQLRASAPSGARRSDLPDDGSCSPAFTDSVRVGGRRRLPRVPERRRSLGSPASAGSLRRGRKDRSAVVLDGGT